MAAVVVGPWEGLTIGGGRYVRLSTLAQGKVGYAYRALDQQAGAAVVIKSPSPTLFDRPEKATRFEEVIKTCGRAQIARTVPVVGLGRHDELPFVVTPFLAGGNLDAHLPRDQAGRRIPAPPQDLSSWLPAIAKALDIIHRQGCWHRDVQPANILFDQRGGAFLGDFCLLQATSAIAGNTLRFAAGNGQSTVGLAYAAPELMAGAPVDGCADQYALAVVALEALAGKRLATSTNSTAARTNQAGARSNQANTVAQLALTQISWLPMAMGDSLERALATDPRQRFATCGEFVNAMLEGVAQRSSGAATPAPAGRPAPASAAATSASSSATVDSLIDIEPALKPSSRPASVTAVPGAQRVSPVPPARKSRRLQFVAFSLSAVVFAGAALLAVSQWASQPPQAGDTGSSRDTLPKRIAQWRAKADRLDSGMAVDSEKLLANPTYASAAQFEELLASGSSQSGALSAQDVDALQEELTSMADAHDARARQLTQRRQQLGPAADPEARQALASDIRANDDEGSQLISLAKRLQSLRRSIGSSKRQYDAQATAELTALGEMEAAVAAERKPTISADTLKRAVTLSTANNDGLAWLAVNVLARSTDESAQRMAIDWLKTYPPERQSALCWSLLVSGTSLAIERAAEHLKAHHNQLVAIAREPLVKLVDSDPAGYQAMIPALVTSSPTVADRLSLLQLQGPAMNGVWAAAIREECATGLLRDHSAEVVQAIIAGRWKEAYDLATKLLEEHRDDKLDTLSVALLEPLPAEAPRLTAVLAAKFLAQGNKAQRGWALGQLTASDSPLDVKLLPSWLGPGKVLDPTSLVNQLLRATNAKALDLAEPLLARRAEVQANRIDYQAASSEALERQEIRNSLVELAWDNLPDGRRWALGQLLGPDSTRQLAEADGQRLKQAELLKPVIAALGGKVVTIANISGSSHDRGLQVTQRELRRLSTQVDPLAWGPESPVRKRLDEIRQHLAPLKDTVAEPYRPVLASVDSYLVKLTELNEFAYELASVYDVTVVKQLPGAQRAMQLRQLDTWDFRYTAGNLEKFHRTVSAYQELLKTLDELRATLPL